MATEKKETNIYQKLKCFKDAVENIAKDGKNIHFKSKYSTIESVLETINAPLGECGLTFTQIIDENHLITQIIDINTSDKIESKIFLLNKKADMQGFGSAVTYARRYALVSMLGLIQEDDDGSGVVGMKPPVTTAPLLIDQTQHDKLRALLVSKNLDYMTVVANWNLKSLAELQTNSIGSFTEWVNQQ